MVGAGAVGCEYLKVMSMMGFSTRGLITCFDSDSVSLSNLSRQRLFRDEDIGKSKSLLACEFVKRYNNDINIKSFNDNFGREK
jgi:ubiquitin-activating enzyme E1